MRSIIKRIPGIRLAYRLLIQLNRLRPADAESINQQLQQILVTQHQSMLQTGKRAYDDISLAGFRCYSQFEEDGIILYVL